MWLEHAAGVLLVHLAQTSGERGPGIRSHRVDDDVTVACAQPGDEHEVHDASIEPRRQAGQDDAAR
jgi:hypothetical protein